MDRIRFTQSALYHLASVHTMIRRRDGRTYRLSNQPDLEDLLRAAIISTETEIQREFGLLYNSLWEEEKTKLLALFEVL